uniref:Uncharacterized protein n=1 Tax=Arundo donax TaxID=35708 RepID=A0A0A9HPH8_ARUDO
MLVGKHIATLRVYRISCKPDVHQQHFQTLSISLYNQGPTDEHN